MSFRLASFAAWVALVSWHHMAAAQQVPVAKQTLHVDCSFVASTESTAFSVGSEQNPINSLATLNAKKLNAGTHVLFKRGSTCYGQFKPATGSSGTAEAPIVVNAYGNPALGRPVIAAGCKKTHLDATQAVTEAAKMPGSAVSSYYSLCIEDAPARPDNSWSWSWAAIHLYNVQHWEINSVELTNDSGTESPRLGLLVQLDDFGTGKHYRVNDVYVHHVRSVLDNRGERTDANFFPAKKGGGIQFRVTRDKETASAKSKRTNFEDVIVENSEIYNVDLIGLSIWSDWMCREEAPPCRDYKPYANKVLPIDNTPATQDARNDWFASTNVIFRNNKIHNIGGDGIVVRVTQGARVESNLIYDIWMRASRNSAGAWAINADETLFRFNEVHSVRKRNNDGNAFDADMGARNTKFVSNYSHDNGGGFLLLCGCGGNEFGKTSRSRGTIAEGNLSVDDRYRLVFSSGTDDSSVRNNIFLNSTGAEIPVLEINRASRFEFARNTFIDFSGTGAYIHRASDRKFLPNVVWSGNNFIGYAAMESGLALGSESNTVNAGVAVDKNTVVQNWMTASGFEANRYNPNPSPKS